MFRDSSRTIHHQQYGGCDGAIFAVDRGANKARVELFIRHLFRGITSRIVDSVPLALYSQRNNLQMPNHASPKDVVAMPNLRLRMPNMDLLARILARCRSSCALPEK